MFLSLCFPKSLTTAEHNIVNTVCMKTVLKCFKWIRVVYFSVFDDALLVCWIVGFIRHLENLEEEIN